MFSLVLCISKKSEQSCLCNQKNLLTSGRNRVRTNNKTLFIAVSNFWTDGSSHRHNDEKKHVDGDHYWVSVTVMIHAARRSFACTFHTDLANSFPFAWHLFIWNKQGFTESTSGEMLDPKCFPSTAVQKQATNISIMSSYLIVLSFRSQVSLEKKLPH